MISITYVDLFQEMLNQHNFEEMFPLLSEVVPKRVKILSSSDNYLSFAKKCSSIPKLHCSLQSEIYFIWKCFHRSFVFQVTAICLERHGHAEEGIFKFTFILGRK